MSATSKPAIDQIAAKLMSDKTNQMIECSIRDQRSPKRPVVTSNLDHLSWANPTNCIDYKKGGCSECNRIYKHFRLQEIRDSHYRCVQFPEENLDYDVSSHASETPIRNCFLCEGTPLQKKDYGEYLNCLAKRHCTDIYHVACWAGGVCMRHWCELCKEYSSQIIGHNDKGMYNIDAVHVASPTNMLLNIMRTLCKEYIKQQKYCPDPAEKSVSYPSEMPMQDVEREVTEFQGPETKPLTPPPDTPSVVLSESEIRSKYYGGPPMSKEAIHNKYYSDVIRKRDSSEGESVWFTDSDPSSEDEMPVPKRKLKPKYTTKPGNHIKILQKAYALGAYPSKDCIDWVMQNTKLKYGQIRNWFYGERTRRGHKAKRLN